MVKWISGIIILVIVVAMGFWFSIDKNVRYLILNQPTSENPLFWTTRQRDAAFQAIELINVLPFKIVNKGELSSALVKGEPLKISHESMIEYFETLRIGGLVVLHKGQLVYEKYGLGFQPNGKWTSFSVAKSITSTLVGAAIKDGYIASLDDKVTDYIPSMKGSAYDDVSVKQLLTMTSGVDWNEDYGDPNSDVNQFNYHKAEPDIDSTASYMRTLSRASEPGQEWLYSTGETNLIGVIASQAAGKPLHQYLSEKVWSKMGAEQNASWLLGPTGHEISGCCIQASTRDFALYGEFIRRGAMVDGESIVPDGWFNLATTNQVTFGKSARGYGFQWWTSSNSNFEARGIFGQGIYIERDLDLIIAVNANWEKATERSLTQKRTAMYQEIAQLIRQQMP